MVQNCAQCQELLPSKPCEHTQHSTGDFPLEMTSSDLFQGGKDYLVYTDRYSGMIWCNRLQRTQTKDVTTQLNKWMLDFGYPRSIRTDGGPQYRTPFKEWCAQKGIEHEVSSPYNPQSNDHAECAVKQAKYLFCLLYTSPSPRDKRQSRMPSSA